MLEGISALMGQLKAAGITTQLVMALIAIITAILVAWLLAAAAMEAIRGITRHRFVKQFGLRRLPDDIDVRKDRTSINDVGSYSLGIPVWLHPKADGTRDRRYNADVLVARRSVMRVAGWEISSYDPVAMNGFVTAMRQGGLALPFCEEEAEKARQVAIDGRNALLDMSPMRLYLRFKDDSVGFEHWCARLIRCGGAKVEVTPPSNDGGYDLDIRGKGIRTIAECKCYHPTDGTVGRPLLQKLVGANATEHAQGMMFITTSRFSAPAKRYADEQHIRLVDGKRLVAIERRYRSRGLGADAALATRPTSLTPDDITRLYPPDFAGPIRQPGESRGAAWAVLLFAALMLALTCLAIGAYQKGTGMGASPWPAQGLPGVTVIVDGIMGAADAGMPAEGTPTQGPGQGEQPMDGGRQWYVLPDSDIRSYSPGELMGMSAGDLLIARNEIYARHGYAFANEALAEHFAACPWYAATTAGEDFDEGVLSQVESGNVQTILGVETPKRLGAARYVASYANGADAGGDAGGMAKAHGGHIDIDSGILTIDGTWRIDGDATQDDGSNVQRWAFRLAGNLAIRSAGGDAPDSNLRTMGVLEANEMFDESQGIGLSLTTNEGGEVTLIEWLS